MDDAMDDGRPHIQCDVELQLTGPQGGSIEAVMQRTANVLRQVATQLEAGQFGDGHHELADDTGQPAGTVYLDFSEVFD